jgi:hypothetical protein
MEVGAMSRDELFIELAAVLRRAGWDPAEAAMRALLAMGPGPAEDEVDLGAPDGDSRAAQMFETTVTM